MNNTSQKDLSLCFVTEDYSPSFIGGQGVWGHQLVRELTKQGVKVTVIAENRPGRKGIELVPFCFGNQLLLAIFEYVYFIVRLHKRQFDILHANQLTALFFILFKPKNIGKIVVSVHNTWDQMGRFPLLVFLETYIFRHADGLLFHTESERLYAVNRYNLVGTPTAVVPMGTPRVADTSRRQHGGVPVILYVGRLVRRKHVDSIVRALALLQKTRTNVQGIIIGQGPDRKYLESISPSNIRFMGFVKDTSSYFQRSDVFVLPSVAEGGVALAAYEAAAHGLPLLLSPDAADPNILKDGENGYIVDPADPNALAATIQDALKNLKTFGVISRQKARVLTWEKTASGTLLFYRQLLEKVGHIE